METTMRISRIQDLMNELYDRLGSALATLEMLKDDYEHHRRAAMQVRKGAQRCMADTNVFIDRFYAIGKNEGIDEEWCTVKKFNERYRVYVQRCIYFK